MKLSGVFTAIITPFRDGVVALDEFERIIEEQSLSGVDGIVVAGTTGESPTLSEQEFAELVRCAVKIVKNKVKIFAGTGSYDTKTAVHKSQLAERCGADGLLIVTPYYNKPTQNGIIDYYSQIANSTNIPIVMYSILSRCGIEISIETAKILHENHKNIVGIKEASASCRRIFELAQIDTNSFSTLSGDDAMILPFMSLGATGVVSVASNIIPKKIIEIVQKCNANNFTEARKLYYNISNIVEKLFVEVNPLPVKYIMQQLHKISSCECRSPIGILSDSSIKILQDIIREI